MLILIVWKKWNKLSINQKYSFSVQRSTFWLILQRAYNYFVFNCMQSKLHKQNKYNIVLVDRYINWIKNRTLMQQYMQLSVLFWGVNLRNESVIWSVDRGINPKNPKNCINVRSVLLHKFSVLFSYHRISWSIIRSTEEIYYFLSFNFHFISAEKSVILIHIISNFWRCRDTYDVTIQLFVWCKNHLNFLTNQNKR